MGYLITIQFLEALLKQWYKMEDLALMKCLNSITIVQENKLFLLIHGDFGLIKSMENSTEGLSVGFSNIQIKHIKSTRVVKRPSKVKLLVK